MKKHITHFNDCGCLTKKYEDKIDELKKEIKRLKKYENAWKKILKSSVKEEDSQQSVI